MKTSAITYSGNSVSVNSTMEKLFDPLFIGFDRFFDNYSSISTNSYPPYNVIKVNDCNYLIEIAVAGFGKNDIDITEQGGVLRIEGSILEVTERPDPQRALAEFDDAMAAGFEKLGPVDNRTDLILCRQGGLAAVRWQ
jgi:HSP20 family molecular chaperone IbpA